MYTGVITILVILVILTRYINNSLSEYYFVTRIYNILEYTLLSYFYSLYIRQKIINRILFFSPIPFFIFCVTDYLSTKESTLAFLPLIFEYLVLLIFIIYYFFEVIQDTVLEPIYTKAIFWISVAFILNFSGNFFLFLYSRTSYTNEIFKTQFTIIYSSVTILKNILLCIGVMMREKKSANPLSNISSLNSEFDSFNQFRNLS